MSTFLLKWQDFEKHYFLYIKKCIFVWACINLNKTETIYLTRDFYSDMFELQIRIITKLPNSVITKLPNSEQSYKGKVKTHKYINRQNQSTTGKLWKPDLVQAWLLWLFNTIFQLYHGDCLFTVRKGTSIHCEKTRSHCKTDHIRFFLIDLTNLNFDRQCLTTRNQMNCHAC